MLVLKEITRAVINGSMTGTDRFIEDAMSSGISAQEILNEALLPAMRIVGNRMQSGDIFIPEVLMSARVMQSYMNILKPKLQEAHVQRIEKMVIGTVKGDLHDIGKNLVSMMIEGIGIEVVDLGKDVEPSQFVEAIILYKPKLVGMSAMLTTTMQNMNTTIKVIKDAELRDKVKIIIGGAPVTVDFSRQIGADGWAGNASEAINVARKLVES